MRSGSGRHNVMTHMRSESVQLTIEKMRDHAWRMTILPSMSGMKLDPIDLRILAEIQRDGRITKLALAERVGLSPTPCWTRLRRLERSAVVAGYYAKIALRLLVPVSTVFVEITLGA